jgi:NAD(P)H-dependent FMN reductase
MLKLNVIIASTRPGRAGEPIGKWFFERAQRHGKFECRLVDLKEVNLPLIDEPQHPSKRQYQHAHTKEWSQITDPADAFVFVTPEYNFSLCPALANALDYLFHEWCYKPAGFVSYGGAAGGTRSVAMIKQLATSLKMMPIPEGVMIPFFTKSLKDGVFDCGDVQDEAIARMLDELLRWATALKPMRTG